jgi:hypothetical protein
VAHKKRKRKSILDEFFAKSSFSNMETAFEKLSEKGGLEGGYSINVVQTSEGTKVHAKIGKDVNVGTLRKQLQEKYPGAKIEIEGGKSEPLIREISTKPIKKEKDDET